MKQRKKITQQNVDFTTRTILAKVTGFYLGQDLSGRQRGGDGGKQSQYRIFIMLSFRIKADLLIFTSNDIYGFVTTTNATSPFHLLTIYLLHQFKTVTFCSHSLVGNQDMCDFFVFNYILKCKVVLLTWRKLL